MKRDLLAIALILFVVITACKKDKDEVDPFSAAYTDETVEQSKTNVEDNAIALLNEVEDLKQATAIEVLMHMTELPPPTDLSSQEPGTPALMSPVSFLTSLNMNNANPSTIFSMMKSTAEAYEDPFTATAIWDSLVGKYTYNPSTDVYDKTPLSDEIVIEFPGKSTDQTNTAVLTISDFGIFEITEPISEWPDGLAAEVPSSISVDLTYSGTSIAGFTFTGSYMNDGMPTKIKTVFTLDDFSFTFDVTHSPYTQASITETFKRQDKILVELYAKADGDWSENNIEANVDDGGFEEIIKSANAHFIFMNIKITGRLDITALANEMKSLEDQYYNESITEEEAVDAEVIAINENADLVVTYIDQNKKIAEIEAYKVEDQWTGYGDVVYTDYWVDMRMVYNDGSKVDMETYFNNELNNFYTEINNFIADLNADYNMNIDPIDISN